MTARLFSRRSLAILLAACSAGLISVVAPNVASAQHDPAVETFLNSIYSAYKGNSDRVKGIPLNSDETVRRYFEPSLAAAIIKDAADAKQRGEVPKLSGDPFIDGQDWDIPRFTVAVKEAGADKVVGTVTINNFGKDIPLILDLVKGPDGWRIANIMWERGDTIRSLYFAGEPQPAVKKPPAKASKKSSAKTSKKPPKRDKKS